MPIIEHETTKENIVTTISTNIDKKNGIFIKKITKSLKTKKIKVNKILRKHINMLLYKLGSI